MTQETRDLLIANAFTMLCVIIIAVCVATVFRWSNRSEPVPPAPQLTNGVYATTFLLNGTNIIGVIAATHSNGVWAIRRVR